MRIFLICQQSLRRHAVPAYAFWERYFKEGIAEAGHEWVEAAGVDWAEGLLPLDPESRARWSDRTWTQTLAALKAEHARSPFHFVLCYLFPAQVEPAAIKEIQSLGIPCVNFFCDNVREFTRVPVSFNDFALHWVPEYEGCALYRAERLPFVHAPMPVWIPPALRQFPEREETEIVFIGSHDPLREALLASAAGQGLPLRLYGAGWKPAPSTAPTPVTAESPSSPPPGLLSNQLNFLRTHGLRGFAMKLTYKFHRPPARAWIDAALQPPIDDDEYLRITRESAVTLGINRYPSFRHSFNRPHAYSRLRDIEAPMLGACYLTEACPGLDQLYEPGREIETYRDASELAAKASELLANPARRHELRVRGQQRALRDHTIGRSLEKIAAALALRPPRS